jgi:hypothetical protein
MPDILDSYISKIDTRSIPKKINVYISKIKLQRDRIIKIATLRFEILRIKLQLKIGYMKLGQFISKNYDKENVVDFSYKEEFFLLNQDISKKKRYIRKLKNSVKK